MTGTAFAILAMFISISWINQLESLWFAFSFFAAKRGCRKKRPLKKNSRNPNPPEANQEIQISFSHFLARRRLAPGLGEKKSKQNVFRGQQIKLICWFASGGFVFLDFVFEWTSFPTSSICCKKGESKSKTLKLSFLCDCTQPQSQS